MSVIRIKTRVRPYNVGNNSYNVIRIVRAYPCVSMLSLLFHFPDVVGFKQFAEVVILLRCLDLLYLLGYCFIVGRSLNVADNTESNGETVVIAHQSELQLQGVVLAVCIVNEDIVLGDRSR